MKLQILYQGLLTKRITLTILVGNGINGQVFNLNTVISTNLWKVIQQECLTRLLNGTKKI